MAKKTLERIPLVTGFSKRFLQVMRVMSMRKKNNSTKEYKATKRLFLTTLLLIYQELILH